MDNDLITEFERPDYEAHIAEAHLALGDAAFDAAFKKGAGNDAQGCAYVCVRGRSFLIF
jgi:hypothetical protein